MIRKFLLSSAALAAMAGTAFAADLPSRRAPPVYVPPPLPVFSWTGFYVGGHVGYAFGTTNTALRAANGTGPTTAFSQQPHGVIGGAHGGYNLSTQSLGVPFLGGFGAGGLVIGVEGDIDGTDYQSTRNFGAVPVISSFRVRKDFEGSARGRVGVAVDRALFFATGGAAFAEFRTTAQYATPAGTAFNSLSNSRVGWTVGGGVEYAITTQWSLRGEYRYSDFGTYSSIVASPAGNVAARFRNIQQRAQVGVSYKFDTAPAPVVARY